MKNVIILSLTCLLTQTVLHAQIGKVGINTTTPVAMLHVKDSSVLFTGINPPPGTGNTPVSGAGTRMMWYPNKAAFRAGNVTGNHWNRDSIGLYSIALGKDTKAKGSNSTALGEETIATGLGATAIGYGTRALHTDATAMGSSTTASGFISTAMGEGTLASGSKSTAMGVATTASGSESIAMGGSTTASGFRSTAIGNSTTASGISSMAMGSFTTANNNQSTAMGSSTIASGAQSTATGSSTMASGSSSFSTGIGSEAFGIGSTATGIGTYAFGDYSTSMGEFTEAIGETSVTMGSSTEATGENSVAMGSSTEAEGDASLAMGDQTSARSFASVVMGRFNDLSFISPNTWNLLDPVFIIGNGTTSSARNNAVTVLKNGNVGINTPTPLFGLHVVSNDAGDGGWVQGVVIDNTAATGEAAVSFRNTTMPSNKHWSVGLNQTPLLSFGYGSSFAGGSGTRMVIDTFGNVGISTTTPATKLHVSNGVGGGIHNYNSLAELILEDNSSSYIQFSTPGNVESGVLSGNDTTEIRSALIFRADSSVQIRAGGNFTRMVVNQDGLVGIGTTAPTEKLHVVGDICYTGSIAACSDIRYKKKILPISNVLNGLQSIQGIYYNWDQEKFIDKEFDDARQIGFSAQELELVFPEMVHTDIDGYKSVDYSRMTPVLVEAIKEQQEIISSQQIKLDSQQVRLEALEKELEELKSLVLQMSSPK